MPPLHMLIFTPHSSWMKGLINFREKKQKIEIFFIISEFVCFPGKQTNRWKIGKNTVKTALRFKSKVEIIYRYMHTFPQMER